MGFNKKLSNGEDTNSLTSAFCDKNSEYLPRKGWTSAHCYNVGDNSEHLPSKDQSIAHCHCVGDNSEHLPSKNRSNTYPVKIGLVLTATVLVILTVNTVKAGPVLTATVLVITTVNKYPVKAAPRAEVFLDSQWLDAYA